MGTKNIAIDGPAGAGKSTIAKRVAKTLGFIYVDTGALYRAVGLYMMEQGIPGLDQEAVGKHCREAKVELSYGEEGQLVFLNGRNVTQEVRKEEAGKMASAVGTNPVVREYLLDLQRDIAKKQNVVMDGRDIGTSILPQADLKIYLTASSKERARRRAAELREKGESPDESQIEQDIIARDNQDKNRAISPLRKAEDAREIDSSALSIEEVTEKILEEYRKL